ncbi:MAG: hypothetical protein II656_03960 [Ruminococcus sp.]|nr:hypothetical protein [Ruminococcus sp.]
MARRKIDWDAIKTEYVTGNMGQNALIKKYKIDQKLVAKHSKEDGWVKARKEYREKVQAKAQEKFANKRANELAGVLSSSYKIRDTIEQALKDPQQFNRYLVTKGRKGGEFETVEEVHEKLDTKAIREMTQALKAVEGLIRSLNNIPTEAEMQRLQLERERFEMEKEKWEREKAEQSAAHEVRITFDTDDMDGWTE